MPTVFEPGFIDYLEGLPIEQSTKDNYRQYVRWIEQYGSIVLDAETIKDDAKLNRFIDELEKKFDADKTTRRWVSFSQRRKDAKVILRHYLRFLQAKGIAVEQKQIQLDKAGEFSPTDTRDGKEKVLRSIALRRGQYKFRRELLRAYDGKCAITGTALGDILEAAHIVPYNGVSTNHISNGLLLRSDIHALFDLGLLSVDPKTMRVYCSQRVIADGQYGKLSGVTLRRPSNANDQPSAKALQSHFDNRVP